MKARKKQIEIDFFNIEEWIFFTSEKPLIEWVESFGDKFDEHFKTDFDPFELYVKTLEGTSYEVTDDDVIIRGIKGEYYPCKKDIFNQTYDIIN